MNAAAAAQLLRPIPKHSSPSSAASPPPAYTPGRQLDLQSLTARHLQLQQSGPVGHRSVDDPGFIMGCPPVSATMLDNQAREQQQDDSDSSDDLSPISLRINTSINVSSSNNFIFLSSTPADHANAIAQAVVKAIQENSSGQCGIPMIDEDGRPRPIRIEVDAGISVHGTGNILGGDDAHKEFLNQRRLSLRRQRDEDDDGDDELRSPFKRRCSSSD